MKSALICWLAIQSKEPTAYISADTDAATLAKRAIAGLTGKTFDEIDKAFDRHDPIVEQYYEVLKRNVNHIRWDFDRAPDLRSIEELITSYEYLHCEDPAIVVIDNLKNVWADNEGEGGDADHSRANAVIEGLKQIAGNTGACIIVLHHTTGQYESGSQPIPLSGILGKVSKDFRLVLTLRRDDTMLHVSVVKNTSGPADPDGYKVRAAIPVDPQRMQFNHHYDPTTNQPQPWRA
jgi:hypothetical protein